MWSLTGARSRATWQRTSRRQLRLPSQVLHACGDHRRPYHTSCNLTHICDIECSSETSASEVSESEMYEYGGYVYIRRIREKGRGEVPPRSSPEFSDLDSLCDQCILVSASLSWIERFPRPFQREDLGGCMICWRGVFCTPQMWRSAWMIGFFFRVVPCFPCCPVRLFR